MVLKTTALTEKNNPNDFEGFLLQLFLILKNKFFLLVWFLQEQKIAPVANLEFLLRTFFGSRIPPPPLPPLCPPCKDEQPIKSIEL